jgi:hypothetical protein
MKRFLTLLALLAALTACHRLPMYEAGSGIYLKLSLRLDPEVAPGENVDLPHHPLFQEKVTPNVPEMFRVCFYDTGSHELVSEDFLPAAGGFVNVPAGVYDVLVYNLGTEVTQVEGTQTRAGGYAFTSQTGTRLKLSSVQSTGGDGEGWENQPVIYEPDHLFVGRIAGAVVPVHPEGREPDLVVLESEPTRLTETWSIEFVDVEGAERIVDAGIYLTGQAAGRYLWDLRAQNHPAALEADCVVDVQHRLVYTLLNTFGEHPATETDVFVSLMLSVEGGGRVRYTFNVTDQWLNPDNTAHRIVITDPVDVPTADYQGGGFDPFVDDWDGEEIDIVIG